ncbi:4-(cytidine 5'-diphospho)-2-C-methyl-D-erythritol kinase [Fodinicurvata sediminis]|uniref:4-(cytidine 5'-diphospho)-2-C-methyl-D-erythritol kinase n=1 Tax=Fodinicurvata sediminis TaxID=1121832 RepID=UPI0003B33DD5|nr:4-(cytidine 5'-diphospho)-2-C-methyl-D-erythritol kinase [Fodinicurvata sediminis]
MTETPAPGPLLQPAQELHEFAPAKVNLWLEITGRRDDGYHLLDSLVVFAEVGDWLEIRPAEAFSLDLAGPFAAALQQQEEDNLVTRAVDAFCAATGQTPAFHLKLTKNLPLAAGLGGGSADAAATLRLLERIQGKHLPPDRRQALALDLGADVPVCLEGRSIHMQGIGEQLLPVPFLPPLHLLLVNPGVPVSTGAIFRRLAQPWSQGQDMPRIDTDPEFLFDVLRKRRNDLEGPACALAPEIAQALAALKETRDCALARMSGSGASCFALYRSTPARDRAAARLRQDHPDWWIA